MSTKRLRVLVVEDDMPLQASLASLFESHGHDVDFAGDGAEGLALALQDPPDVLVLDIGLPRMNGLRVCEELRAREDRHIPILMLTARDTVDDKLQGFEIGADDYLVKPFSGEELLARCLALSRRSRLGEHHLLQVGPLVLDRRSGIVRRDERELALSQTAYQILRALLEAHPRPLSRSELIDHIWADGFPPSDPLRTHLYVLRKELDPPGSPPILRNIHGMGYRLQVDS